MAAQQKLLPKSRDDFETAILCALPLEFDAVNLMLDDKFEDNHGRFGRVKGDDNHYTLGRVGTRHVVVVLFDRTGPDSAAKTATSMKISYGNIKLALLVGVCGGLPTISGREAILGDVVISNIVKQYHVGKQYPRGFKMTEKWEDMLGNAPRDIRNLVRLFQTSTDRRKLRDEALANLQAMQQAALAEQLDEDYARPDWQTDRLFPEDYLHECRNKCKSCSDGEICDTAIKSSCEELHCDMSMLERRRRVNAEVSNPSPQIFVGGIASGSAIIKSGAFRDDIAKALDVVAFEMEGAGIWGDLPCIVIKGICDYADSHKSKGWQDYAALSATAVAKAVIKRYESSEASDASSTEPSIPSTEQEDNSPKLLQSADDAQKRLGYRENRVISGANIGDNANINMGNTNTYNKWY